MPRFPKLEGDLHTDVLIVGGGLAGLLCAENLTRVGVDCVLIEENRLMSGVSGRTTAKLTSQHGMIYGKLLKKLGAEQAGMYYRANQEALEAYRSLADRYDFDFQHQTACLYARDSVAKLEEELAAYEQLRIPCHWATEVPLPFSVAGALSMSHQAQFHPMKLASKLAAGLRIYENTKAISFHGKGVETAGGVVTAENIVIATHFPLLNKHGAYFLKLYQQRSYVLALEHDPIEGMYLDCEENGLSLRSAGKWLLLGGGGHRTGKTGAGWTLAESAAKQYYPHAPEAARWATQDCMTLDAMPYIGRYSPATANLYVATGFQKWGMSTSMVAATILTDLIQGRENPYARLFSPSRSMLHRQLLINGAETTFNLLRPTKPRCPHLGCALRWNKAEHSWDCPCHGSRFDGKGRRLNDPATDDMKRKSMLER